MSESVSPDTTSTDREVEHQADVDVELNKDDEFDPVAHVRQARRASGGLPRGTYR